VACFCEHSNELSGSKNCGDFLTSLVIISFPSNALFHGVGWSVGWLIGWLVGWLVGWLFG
jgi:hypothetical protein